MERNKQNGLSTPIADAGPPKEGDFATGKARRNGFTSVDGPSDAMPVYEFDMDTGEMSVQAPRGLLQRGPGNADDEGNQRSNDSPWR